jgi:NAD(P)-dependent dehydrogenase (short-subunit alcohol dehydrogenase family)
LRQQAGERVIPVELDVTDERSIRDAAANVGERLGAVDCVINNAAILVGRDKKIEDLDLDLLRASFEVNLFGAMMTVKHFLPLLRRGNKPVIINVSSEAGSITGAYGGDYPYALTKTALNMFSQKLARGLAGEGMLVYAVHPGWMRTDMGGSKAPLDPLDSARGILQLATREKVVEPAPFVFIDYQGNAMPI